mmetsp:Transcript_75085/g.208814  ORF Transcript_75085/g.208814 Transcript_75085/m.208814 type:complete len:220 (+) Transcript_75085:557-1216(+)
MFHGPCQRPVDGVAGPRTVDMATHKASPAVLELCVAKPAAQFANPGRREFCVDAPWPAAGANDLGLVFARIDMTPYPVAELGAQQHAHREGEVQISGLRPRADDQLALVATHRWSSRLRCTTRRRGEAEALQFARRLFLLWPGALDRGLDAKIQPGAIGDGSRRLIGGLPEQGLRATDRRRAAAPCQSQLRLRLEATPDVAAPAFGVLQKPAVWWTLVH